MTTTSTMNTALQCLRAYRFDVTDEEAFQSSVALGLSRSLVHFTREVQLSDRDRIDFMLADGVGLELKIKGGETAVLRQLARYAKSDQVRALVLATSRALLSNMPGELNGKPLVVHLQGGI